MRMTVQLSIPATCTSMGASHGPSQVQSTEGAQAILSNATASILIGAFNRGIVPPFGPIANEQLNLSSPTRVGSGGRFRRRVAGQEQ